MRRLSSPSTTASTRQHDQGDAGGDDQIWSPRSAWWAWRMARAGSPEPRCRAPTGSPPPAAARPRRRAPAATRRSGRAAGRGCGRRRTGKGRRIAQPVEADQPGGVVGGLGGQRPPAPAGRRVADGAGLGVGRRIELGLGPLQPGGVGVLAGLDPDHPDPGGCLEVEVDRAELLDAPGGDGGDRLGVGVVAGLVGARSGGSPAVRPRSRKRLRARSRAGWASMDRLASSSGAAQPVRSKRLPAMIRTPGPSQVSRARASSAVTARRRGVASGVSSRSLTTMTRRPRGTSTRVAPGSGRERGGHALGPSGRPGRAPAGRLAGRGHGPSIVEARRR